MPFDPDAFLAADASGFDPDEFLRAPVAPNVGPLRSGFRSGREAMEDRIRATTGAKAPPTRAEAAAMGAMQGATFGFADEMGASLGAAGIGNPMVPNFQQLEDAAKEQRDAGGYMNAYRARRDAVREEDAAAQQAHRGTYLAANIAGALANPIKIGPKGSGLLPAMARGGVEGAVAGFGYSNADTAGGMARDTGLGSLVGVAAGTLGKAIGATWNKAKEAITGGARRRLLNEVAEGTGLTTATGRKRLDKAGDAIADEIIKGPDGDAVLNAVRSGAEKGREQLKPIVANVGQQLGQGYAAFEQAGRHVVDMGDYMLRLGKAAEDALNAGNSNLYKGIQHLIGEMDELARASGNVNLRQLRGFTTQTQRSAASALGSLNEHATAKLKSQISAVATDVMDDMLDAASAGDAGLKAAADGIRANNRRMHALLSVDDGLKTRQYKEATGKSALVRGAEVLSNPAAIAGGAAAGMGALSGDDEGTLEKVMKVGLAVGAAKALPAAARALDRVGTNMAVQAARGQTGLAGRVVRAVPGSAVPPVVRAALEKDQERRRRIQMIQMGLSR